METFSGALWIMGILAAVFLIAGFRRHIEVVINFVLRGVLGLFMIYFGNIFLCTQMPGVELGYNPLTFLASGALGVPGVLMMYGIKIYMLW